jgi:hypothetical protein
MHHAASSKPAQKILSPISVQQTSRRSSVVANYPRRQLFANAAIASSRVAAYLSQQELLKWKPRQGQPENWLFVWCRVTYLDGFGDARFIDFCHRYNLSGSGAGGVMDASACRYHEYGNRSGKLPKGAHRPAA